MVMYIMDEKWWCSLVTIVVLDERSLWEIWSWEFELGGQRAAGSGQGGRGGGRRRRERWRPFFPLGCYCLPISLSLCHCSSDSSLPHLWICFPSLASTGPASVGHFLVVPGGQYQETRKKRGRENTACRLFSFSPQVFPSIALEGYLNERAQKTDCAGALAFRLPRELLTALKH